MTREKLLAELRGYGINPKVIGNRRMRDGRTVEIQFQEEDDFGPCHDGFGVDFAAAERDALAKGLAYYRQVNRMDGGRY